MQQRRVLFHVDARDRAFAHADTCSAIAGDEAAEELEEIGIVADHEHVLPVSVLPEELLEIGVGCVEIERRTYLDLAFVSEFIADKLRGLERTLQGAGNNDIGLDFEGAKHAPHHHALLFAFRDEASFGVELNALAGNSSIGMAHQVEIHVREAGVSGRAESLALNLDFNMFVTLYRVSGCVHPAAEVAAAIEKNSEEFRVMGE